MQTPNNPENLAPLVTERLYFLPLNKEYYAELYTLEKSPEVKKYFPAPKDIEKEIAKMLEQQAYKQQKYGYSYWAVHLRDTHEFIGRAGLCYFEDVNQIEVGYAFLPEYWGKGYATETLKHLIKWGFAHTDEDVIIAFTHRDNLASLRVIEKVGMTFLRNDVFEELPVKYYSITRS